MNNGFKFKNVSLRMIGILTAVFGVVWFIMVSYAAGTDKWSGVEAITAVGALTLTFGAAFIVFIQLEEATDSRNLEVYVDIHDKFKDENEIRARRHIYQQIPDLPDDASDAEVEHVLASPDNRDAIKQVLNQLDYFGFLVAQDWASSDEIIGWMSPVVVKLWAKLQPIFAYELRHRTEEPDYYRHVVTLVDKCSAWRKKNLPILKERRHVPPRTDFEGFDDKRL